MLEQKGMRALFCVHCGSVINEKARFCNNCGAALEQEAYTAAPVSQPAAVQAPFKAASSQRRSGGGMRWLILPAAILLLIMGIGYMGLTVAGKTTRANVTGYEQQIYVNNDDSTRDPRRYKVDYEFAVNGKRYTGSVTRIFEGGSHMGKTLPIRYLLIWPHINAEDGSGTVVAGPLMAGLGVFLCVVELKARARLRAVR